MSTINKRKHSGLGMRAGHPFRPKMDGLSLQFISWLAVAFSMLLMVIIRWLTREEPRSESEEIVLVEFKPRPQLSPSAKMMQAVLMPWKMLHGSHLSGDKTFRYSPRGLAVAGGILLGSVIHAFFGAAWDPNLPAGPITQAQSGVEAASGGEYQPHDGWLVADTTAEETGGREVVPSSSPEIPFLSASNQQGSSPAEGVEEKQMLTASRTHQLVSTEEFFYEPAGCQQPPNKRGWVSMDGWRLPLRTIQMLQHAADLYGAELDLAVPSLASNSIRSGKNTLRMHVEQGTIMISMTYPESRHVLYSEIDPLVTALRVAGFAAWYQERVETEEARIIAITIGEPDLSKQEKELVYGDYGYFRGFFGTQNGEPLSDPHGGPIVCGWMIDQGYADRSYLYGDDEGYALRDDWRERLRTVAETFITNSTEQTFELARKLGYLGGTYEHPSNMCGPLTAAILLEADLIPSSVGPIRDPKSFWLSNPKLNGRPWMFFPEDMYEIFRSQLPLNYFQFEEWPLCAGDIVFTYAGNGEFSHVFVVTEVDELGRVFTVTNQAQAESGFLVERLMLYTTGDSMSGVFRNGWSKNAAIGRTGLGGFEVLRRRGVCLQPGALFDYKVRPGDTLVSLAEQFSTTVEAIRDENLLSQEFHTLEVGQELRIPVNTNLSGRVRGG